MREILFRGQTRRKGEKVRMGDGKPINSNWVYGGIFPQNDGGDFAVIYQQEPEIKKFSVYADTVGQYTGRMDKKERKIFEGDILKSPIWLNGKYQEICVCKWVECEGVYDIQGFGLFVGNKLLKTDEWDEFEIIGNIFDNPELLETK